MIIHHEAYSITRSKIYNKRLKFKRQVHEIVVIRLVYIVHKSMNMFEGRL